MLIKMKSGIEGFVWWLSIVHRSLLRFLFDLEILKPQPVPSLPIHSKCALLQRPRHPILQPCSILWGVGTSSFISFAGTWSAHTLAHMNNDLVAPVTERCFSAGMDSRGLWARVDGLWRQRTGPQKTHAIPWENTWRSKYKNNRTMVELQKTGCASWGW